MSEKNMDAIHDSKSPPQYGALHESPEKPHTELVDDTGARRASVALNIVQNPLQVR